MIQSMTCPICKKPLDGESAEQKAFQPFCSDRCRRIDFHRWWDGKYAIVEDFAPDNIDPDMLDHELDAN